MTFVIEKAVRFLWIYDICHKKNGENTLYVFHPVFPVLPGTHEPYRRRGANKFARKQICVQIVIFTALKNPLGFYKKRGKLLRSVSNRKTLIYRALIPLHLLPRNATSLWKNRLLCMIRGRQQTGNPLRLGGLALFCWQNRRLRARETRQTPGILNMARLLLYKSKEKITAALVRRTKEKRENEKPKKSFFGIVPACVHPDAVCRM
jgi:hypothetical protein